MRVIVSMVVVAIFSFGYMAYLFIASHGLYPEKSSMIFGIKDGLIAFMFPFMFFMGRTCKNPYELGFLMSGGLFATIILIWRVLYDFSLLPSNMGFGMAGMLCAFSGLSSTVLVILSKKYKFI